MQYFREIHRLSKPEGDGERLRKPGDLATMPLFSQATRLGVETCLVYQGHIIPTVHKKYTHTHFCFEYNTNHTKFHYGGCLQMINTYYYSPSVFIYPHQYIIYLYYPHQYIYICIIPTSIYISPPVYDISVLSQPVFI